MSRFWRGMVVGFALVAPFWAAVIWMLRGGE